RHANAAGRRGGPGLPPLIVPVLLALSAGCTTTRSPRPIEGEAALAQLGRDNPPVLAATPSLRLRPEGPAVAARAPARADDAPPAGLPSDRRVRIASAHATVASATPTPARTERASDKGVQRAAHPEGAVPVPSPPVIPAPSGEYPIDLATALRLADVAN